MLRHILVAVDGSAFSFRAARLGAEIMHHREGTLTLLYVAKSQSGLEWFQGPGNRPGTAAEEERRALDVPVRKGQEILKEARSHCKDLLSGGALRLELVVVPGEPAQKIVENAEKKACDLIIMGSRGAGRLKGAILGSVSQKVLTSTKCPVLIVK